MSGRRWLKVLGCWAILFFVWIDSQLQRVPQDFRRVIRLQQGEEPSSSSSSFPAHKMPQRQLKHGNILRVQRHDDSGATNQSTEAATASRVGDSSAMAIVSPADKDDKTIEALSDPFYGFRSELDWIPNRTLVPWAQLNRTPPCILEPEGVDPLNDRQQRRHAKQGILYIKIEKAASTTLAGVAGRIAYKLVDLVHATNSSRSRTVSDKVHPVCRVRLTHAWSRQVPQPFAMRDRDKSFLFTFVRHPGRRSLSEFYYFGVDGRNATTGNETEPSAAEAMEYLQNPKRGNSQFRKCVDKGVGRLSRTAKNLTWQQKKAWQVQRVVNELDYIGVVERMDESLVGLQLMLGLRPSDVLVPSSKESNTYMDRKGNNQCYFVKKHLVAPEIESYIASNEYRELNYADELLYRVANANLDRFINVIGRVEFEEALHKFRQAKQRMNKECQTVVHKCDANGKLVPPNKRSKCYRQDAGCGFECVDSLFDNGKRGAWTSAVTEILEKKEQ